MREHGSEVLEESPPKILIVEDDRPLAELVAASLGREGYETLIETHGSLAVERIRAYEPDLVILDVMLPGQDGFEVCRKARVFYTGRVLMMTAREEDVDQILGLELGADDYVVKPVRPRVLLARVRAHLRRREVEQKPATLRMGPLTITTGTRQVRIRGEPLSLTTGEFDLLYFMASNAGRVIDRQELYQALRGMDYDGLDRAIDLRVSKVRSKLRDALPDHEMIVTIHGQGYLFVQAPS